MRFGQPLFILPPPPASLSRNLFRICASREEGRLVAEPLLCALSRWGDDADAAYRRGMRQDSTDGRRAGPGTVRGRKPADGADILIEVFLLRGGASGPGSDRICGLSAGGGDWPSQGFGGAPLPPRHSRGRLVLRREREEPCREVFRRTTGRERVCAFRCRLLRLDGRKP